jgi:hypothetical protein
VHLILYNSLPNVAEYFSWCLAGLGSVSYILVGITVFWEKQRSKSLITGEKEYVRTFEKPDIRNWC